VVTDRAERTDARLVSGLLVLDTALLATMELLFLQLHVGAVPVPVSALVALVTNPWLVRRVGELTGPPGATAALVAWVAVVLVLGLFGPGGDALLLGDWPSLLLVLAGMLPGAFALGRVLRAAREAG
jgi:hypothetical protein